MILLHVRRQKWSRTKRRRTEATLMRVPAMTCFRSNIQGDLSALHDLSEYEGARRRLIVWSVLTR